MTEEVYEMTFKIVVSDPKTKKSYQKEVSQKESGLIGKKIRDKVKGDFLGLSGYEVEITGGSDKQGFPMNQSIQGSTRKKVILTGGPGFNPKKKGERRRKSVRGNVIASDIAQINTKIVTYGKKAVEELLGKKEAPKEESTEAKASDAPKVEAKPSEVPKKEPKAEEKKEEPVKEAPKEKPKAEEKPAEEPKKEKPVEVPKEEAPAEPKEETAEAKT